jgi:Tfp pilus assembly protein PilF
VEDEVRSALINTDLSSRTAQYAGIVKRCPISGDLWLWLGKDYLAGEDFDGAERALERVLTVDRDNQEAQELLKSARARRLTSQKN